MSHPITNGSTPAYSLHGRYFPVEAVCVGTRDNLFDKIQHCFFIVQLRVSFKAVFTLFSTTPVQMRTCIAQLTTFKATLEDCDVTSRVQRDQLRTVFGQLPQHIKSKFANLGQYSLARFAGNEDRENNEKSLEQFLKECDWVIVVQKTLLPARNFFSRISDRADPNEGVNLEPEVNTDPRTNPRVKLRNSEKQKRKEDPLVGQLNDGHRKRAKQIAAMSKIIDILVDAKINLRVKTKKLEDEGGCPVKLEIMEVPVYPYTETYNGPLHRFDLEYYLYDGVPGSLEGDAFIAALASKKNFECPQCQKSERGCVLVGQEPSTLLKVDTAFQKMLVSELIRCFTKASDAHLIRALQEKQSQIQAAELSAKGLVLSEDEERQQLLDLINDFPPGSLKQRMQNILGNLYKGQVHASSLVEEIEESAEELEESDEEEGVDAS